MADANNHQMKVGIGYTLDTDSLEQLVQITERINKASTDAASGLKSIESAVKNVSSATTASSKADSDWLKNLKRERDAGLKTVESYNREVINKAKQLRTELDNIELNQGKNSSAYQEKLKSLSTINKEATSILQKQAKEEQKIEQQRLKEQQKIEQQRIKETEKRIKEQEALERKRLKEQEAIEKQITANAQREAKLQQVQVERTTAQNINEFKKLGKEIDKTFTSHRSLGESILNSMLTYGAIREVTNQFQDLGRAIVDINYNTINNQRLMGDFSTSLSDSLNSSAADIARNTGIMITDAQEIQGAWIRINDEYAKNEELLGQISELTAKFMNVGEIEDAEHAVTLLNASLLQFNISASEAMKYAEEFANKWAYMADITAMGTADEYGEAISKFGANVKALNGDMDDAIALSSVMADNLAKSGSEAGNALKTFTTYMNREKTVSLFADIAQDLNDTSFNLVDVNGQMLDFDENLRKIAQAYQIYKSQGNDVMAMDILNAVGATRQRDTAMAVLNSVNDGSYDEYLQKLADPEVNGYIEEQNDALMESLKNQWNSFVVTLQEAGSKIAQAGIIDALEVIMNGATALMSVIGNIPTPFLKAATAFVAFKTGLAGLEKVGEITGLTEELWLSMKAGTSVEREAASATQSVVASLMDREKISLSIQKGLHGETQAYKQQSSSLKTLSEAALAAEKRYASGEITAKEYNETLNELKDSYIAGTQAIKNNAEAGKEKDAADALSANTIKNVAAAESAANNTRKGSLVTLLKEKAMIVANSGLKRLGIQTTIQEKTVEIAANVTRKTSIALNKAFGESEKNATIAKTAGAIASKAAAVGMTTLGAAIKFVTNPTVLLTAAMTIIPMIMGNIKTSAERLGESIENLESQSSEATSRIQELEEIRQSRGLTAGEAEELQYLQDYNAELEKQIKLQSQQKANDEWSNHQGGFLGIGGTDSEKENVDKLIESYKRAQGEIENYQKVLEKGSKGSDEYANATVGITSANKELATTSSELITTYYELNDAIENKVYSGEALEEVIAYRDVLEEMLPTLEMTTGSYETLSDSIQTTTDEMDALSDEMDGISGSMTDLNELFDEYNENGYISYETIGKILSQHPEYVKYLVKEGEQYKLNVLAEKELAQAEQDLVDITDELINKQQEQIENNQYISESLTEAINGVDRYAQGIQNTFGDIEGIDDFVTNLREVNTNLLSGKYSIDEYSSAMSELINSTEISSDIWKRDLSELDEQTRETIQSQQALFSTLSNEIANYLQEATTALMEGNMSVEDYVTSLQASNQQLLDLYANSHDLVQTESGLWYGASHAVNAYANELQNAIDGLNGVADAASFLTDNYSILQQMSSATAEQLANDAWWTQGENANAYSAMYSDFSSLMESLYTENNEAWKAIADKVAESESVQVEDIFTGTGAIADNAQISAASVNSGVTAMMAMVGDAAGQATSAAGDVFTALGDVVKNFDYTISFGITGSINAGGNVLDLLTGKDFKPTSSLKLTMKGSDNSGTIDVLGNALSSLGSSLNNLALKDYLSKIDSYRPTTPSFSGSSGMSSSGYSPSDRYTPATRNPSSSSSKGSSSGSSGKSDAEKAAEEAAKAMEEAMKAIEKLTEQYIKNVESLQDRIVNALKKKYQEQYDERKKLLEKEHNERVEQIQAEIDAINGERPEDKQAELSRLESQLEKWMGDDSTLGKAKQKEYLDQIEELKKEIKLDELEQQLEDENEKYEQSIDSDSEFYDAILKKLDDQMTDEMLYREANDMIRNQKIDEITALLTEFDAQWDGWATLMGKTAGEIIAEEVALAIANYKDVVNGTVTPDGGKETNKITGGGSSSSSSGSGSSSSGSSGSSSGSSSLGKGSRVKITNTSAGMYYTSTSKSAVDNWKGWTGSYYIVNTGGSRYALGTNSSINSAIGWIDKKYVKKFNTGGYTGSDEGFAYLHSKERVLSARQTSAFENLVYDFLPRIESSLLNPTSTTNNSTTTNNNGNVFNKELVSVNIDKVVNNTPFDIKNSEDNLDRMFRQSLRKSGIMLKH